MDDSYTGETIFNKVQSEILIDKDIQRNLMGTSSDQGSNVSSEGVGLAGRLQSEYPYTIHVSDFSHIYNLIFKEGTTVFPKTILDIISDISSHFSRSPQRRAKFDDIQMKLGLDPLQVLKLSETRWLSMKETLERILRLWDPLQVYYGEYEPRGLELFTTKNELFLKVLLTLISKVNHYNIRFQATQIYYDEILDLLDESFIVFGTLVVKKEHCNFDELYNLKFDYDRLDEIEDILLSEEEFAQEFVENNNLANLYNKIQEEHKKEPLSIARKFIIRILDEMKRRLPFQSPILRDIDVVFFRDFDKSKWKNLANKFTNIISQDQLGEFNNELERFRVRFERRYRDKIGSSFPFTAQWRNLSCDFPLLAKLALSIAVLPHSSVPVERIFSQLKDFKTGKRNRLTAKNIESSLLIYQAYGEDTSSILTKEMFENYKVKYKKEKSLEKEHKENEEISLENLFEKSITIEEENIQEISMSKSESKLKRKGVGELVREREGLKKTKY